MTKYLLASTAAAVAIAGPILWVNSKSDGSDRYEVSAENLISQSVAIETQKLESAPVAPAASAPTTTASEKVAAEESVAEVMEMPARSQATARGNSINTASPAPIASNQPALPRSGGITRRDIASSAVPVPAIDQRQAPASDAVMPRAGSATARNSVTRPSTSFSPRPSKRSSISSTGTTEPTALTQETTSTGTTTQTTTSGSETTTSEPTASTAIVGKSVVSEPTASSPVSSEPIVSAETSSEPVVSDSVVSDDDAPVVMMSASAVSEPAPVSVATAEEAGTPGSAYSKPVGYVTETLKGKVNAADPDVFNLIGASLQKSAIKAGTVSSVSATSLTDTNADFSDIAAGTYLLEIETGAQAGFIQEVTSFTANSISLPVDLSSSVVEGDRYKIREIHSLNSIFGTASTTTLGKGNLTTADIVWVSDAVGGFDRYYVAPASPPFAPDPSWTKLGGDSGVGSTPIVYADAIIVQRRTVGDIPVVVTGEVKTNLIVYPVIGGDTSGDKFNYYATPFPTQLSGTGPVTDADTTVQSIGVLSQMTAGNLTTADVLWLPQGDGGYKRYILTPPSAPFKPEQTFDEIGGSTNIDPASVKMPSAFILQKRNTGGSITVNPPSALGSL